jgi:copper(I)-binding protein
MRRTTVGVFAVAALALTGCGVGQNAGVQKAGTSIDGVNIDLNSGQLQVRNVFVMPAGIIDGIGGLPLKIQKGGSAGVSAHIFNNAPQADALVGVEALIGGTTKITQPGQAGAPAGAIIIPPFRLVTIGYSGSPQVLITNLGAARFVGTYITLKLSFANAGTVTINAPVEDVPRGGATT